MLSWPHRFRLAKKAVESKMCHWVPLKKIVFSCGQKSIIFVSGTLPNDCFVSKLKPLTYPPLDGLRNSMWFYYIRREKCGSLWIVKHLDFSDDVSTLMISEIAGQKCKFLSAIFHSFTISQVCIAYHVGLLNIILF